MTVHIFAVGNPKVSEPNLGHVWVIAESPLLTRLDPCGSPRDLVDGCKKHGPVDVLDIYDHGTDGIIYLGDVPLFEIGADGELKEPNCASALAPLLADKAVVRLLGCDVGKSTPGQALLQKLAAALNAGQDRGIVVQATIARTNEAHFGREGFKPDLAAYYLYSSEDAKNGVAPSFHAWVEIQGRKIVNDENWNKPTPRPPANT